MKPKVLICILFFSFLFIHSTDSYAKTRKGSKKPFSVTLEGMGANYPSHILKNKNQHPYDIPEEALVRMMQNFEFQMKKKALSGWEDKKRKVYPVPNKVMRQAAKYLRRALLKANSKQKIVFTAFLKEGKNICEIFVQRDYINWKFRYVHGQPRTQGKWIMSVGYLQKYYGTGDKFFSAQNLLFGGNFKDQRWIEIPLLEFLAELKGDNELVSRQRDKEGKVAGKDKLEKLKTLVALKRKKLITKDLFHSKVESLMKKSAGERLDIESELEYLKILKDEKIISRDAYLQRRSVILDKY